MSDDKRKMRVIVMPKDSSATIHGGVNDSAVQAIFKEAVGEFNPDEYGTKNVRIYPPPILDSESGEPIVEWGTSVVTSILYADFKSEDAASNFRWSIDDSLEDKGLSSKVVVDSASVPKGMG